jgi:hypothetical protein
MDPLTNAELVDGYRKKCSMNEYNSLARRNQYYHEIHDFSLRSAFFIRAGDFEITRDANILLLHPSADSGMPHTRPGNILCFSSDSDPNRLTTTLLHEGMHLEQRRDPNLWKTYHISQGWWPIPASVLPERWVNRCRINPDTLDIPFWSWQNNYVPLPLFANEARPTLTDCPVRWFDLRNQTLLKETPESFKKRYGASAQAEHPNETSAIEFSEKGYSSRVELYNVLTSL